MTEIPSAMFKSSFHSIFALFAGLTSAFAVNWPAWRGPNGDGVTTETNLPLTWSATENVRWKIPLPEPGNSTPIVWGDRIFFTQNEGERRALWCVNRADGKILWQAGPTWKEQERTHQTNPFCASSPVTDGERVIAWFGSAGLWCWDLDGKDLWHIDLGKQDHEWGYGSSPVLADDLCILNFGPGARSFLVGIEKKNGKEIWRFDVPPPKTPEGAGVGQNYIGSWSTPVLVNEAGRKQLVVALPGAVFAFDPKSGAELWHCNGLNPLAYANILAADSAILGLGGFGG